jgi:HAE1 family hydrophobic/amphiphilic exporter-1
MKLVDFSVNRPVAITMIVAAVIILGLVSLSRLAIDFLPEMKLPYAIVITTYEGAGPQEVESTVTKPIEEAVAMVENMKKMQSVSSNGVSMVMAEFEWGTDMNFTVQDIREQIDMFQSMLPDDVGRPMVLKADPSMMPVAVVAFTGDQDLSSLKQVADDVVKPRLERIEGVAAVGVTGGYDREIQILIDPVKMQGYGVSLDTVTQMLRANNLNLSAGAVDEGRREFLVRVPGEYADLHDIARIIVPTPEGGGVRITDFAEIRDGFRDAPQKSRLDQQDSLAFIIQKQPTANTVQVVQKVRTVIAGLEGELPGNVRFRTAFDQALFIEESIGNLRNDIVFGGALAALVIFIFLRSVRSTLIICTAIPVATISACSMIYFSGGTINMLTLGGLALGIGIIVDDAIVVLENIYRHRQNGFSLFESARLGASEVNRAVIGATVTSMAVFVPIVFVQGLASELFAPLALTVAFALGASLLVSLTLIPLLASRMLRVGSAERGPAFLRRLLSFFEKFMDRLSELYRSVLAWAMVNRRKAVGGAAAIFIGSLALVPVVGTEFMPATDQNLVQVKVSMPIGTGINETDRITGHIERVARSIPEVETVFVTVGAGSHEEQAGFGGASPHQAMMDLVLVGVTERQRSSVDVANWLRAQLEGIPGTTIEVDAPSQMMAGGMGAGAPLQVLLKGDDLDLLAQMGEQVVDIVAAVPGTRNIKSSLSEGRPEVQVLVDRDRAAQYGMSVYQVASTIRTSIHGSVATRYKVGGEEVDVRVQFTEGARQNIADLENLTMTTPMGGQVLLRDIARLEIAEGPTKVERMGQARTVVISGSLAGRDLGSVTNDVRKALADYPLPPGYRFEFTGEAQEMADAFGNLAIALILAIVLVYILLAIQFESFLFPFVVMFSVPVSLTGMILGLLITGRSFSVPAFIGVIVAVGIVVKNAIVLIDYVNILRGRGMSCKEAVVTAGPIRLRPILMTAFTTILAMLPIALGIGEGAENQAPLATVVIGGLIFSTLISLVLVPTVYTIFDDWGKGLMGRLKGGSDLKT